MDKMKHRRLQELDHSDFEIVDGEPDIRGWDVRNSVGKKIGEVEDLVIDARQKKVRYMVVDLDNNELDLDHHKVAIPIGLAELHQKDDDVLLPNVQPEQLRDLPKYDKDHLDEDVERKICTTLGRKNIPIVKKSETGNTTKPEEHTADFYQHDYFNDDNLYKHRLHEAKPAQKDDEVSEYERGLKLWERRSEGGIIAGSDVSRGNRENSGQPGSERSHEEREIGEEARMEMVRNRRNYYQQRRSGEQGGNEQHNTDRSNRRDNTIEGRIRDEGLRDG